MKNNKGKPSTRKVANRYKSGRKPQARIKLPRSKPGSPGRTAPPKHRY